MEDIITRLASLPPGISGLTVRDRNGDYNIYINARLNRETQLQTYEHELHHIRTGDFDRPGSADLIEIHAHRAS